MTSTSVLENLSSNAHSHEECHITNGQTDGWTTGKHNASGTGDGNIIMVTKVEQLAQISAHIHW